MPIYEGDKKAAYMGLIGGALLLLALVYGMVQITSASFEGHGPAPAGAAQPGH